MFLLTCLTILFKTYTKRTTILLLMQFFSVESFFFFLQFIVLQILYNNNLQQTMCFHYTLKVLTRDES